MNKRIAKFLRAPSLLLLLTAGVAADSLAAETNISSASKSVADWLGDPVIAKGRGVEVKRSQLDDLMVNYKAALATEGRIASAGQVRRMEQRLLNDLIGTQLLMQKATDEDKRKGKEQFATMLQKLKDEAKLTDAEFDERLAVQLRAQGSTREKWNQAREEQAIAFLVLERELKIAVTDEQVKKFYDDFPARFEEPERVRISHILLSTKDPADANRDPRVRRDMSDTQKAGKRKQAEELQKRARGGEDFIKLVREYSEDPAARSNNGEYQFARGDEVAPQIKMAAFAMTTNQISDVLESPLGYHIVKLLEKIPSRKIEFAKVSENIKSQLKQLEVLKLMPDYLKKLQQESEVQILDEKLKPTAEEEQDAFKSALPEPGPKP